MATLFHAATLTVEELPFEVYDTLVNLQVLLGDDTGIWLRARSDADEDSDNDTTETGTITCFHSPTPDSALRWICASSKKSRLLKRIREIYGELEGGRKSGVDGADQDDANGVDADDVNGVGAGDVNGVDAGDVDGVDAGFAAGDTGVAAVDAGAEGPRKRKRAGEGMGTRDANRKAREMALEKFAAGWRNSQVEASQRPDDISDQELRYARFLAAYPRLGDRLAGEMVKRASVVATWDAFKDWSVVMRYWRRRSDDLRNQLDGPTQPCRFVEVVESGDEEEDAVPTPTPVDVVRRGLRSTPSTLHVADSLKELYFAVLNAEASEGFQTLRNRWLCSHFYKEAQRRERELRLQGARSGRMGISLMSVAKEQMFEEFYATTCGSSRLDKVSHAREWEDLSRVLERGSRWSEFENAFGPGIFVLLGYSRMPNTFVEKTLHADQVKIWIKLLQQCDTQLGAMAKKIEPVFQACMAGRSPPACDLALERVTDWDRARVERPLRSMMDLIEPLSQEL